MDKLVKRCLNLRSDERPTMKEVGIELEGLRKFSKHPWTQQEDREESEALLCEKQELPFDLYAIHIGPESNTGLYSVGGSLDSQLVQPHPR